MWKSDGTEQKFLEKLFREKLITVDMKPGDVQKRFSMFRSHSAPVFRKHFTLTRQMFNDNMMPESLSDPLLDTIPELGGAEESRGQIEKKCKLDDGQALQPVEFSRAPVIPCIYTDPESKHDKCLVVLTLFKGVKSITFDLIESSEGPGPTLKVTYGWPSTMFQVESIFKNDENQEMIIPILHPKIVAVETALKLYRSNMEEAPVGYINVKLPVQVQMDPSTWSKSFNKKADGTVIVFFEFVCIRNDYVISKVEKE